MRFETAEIIAIRIRFEAIVSHNYDVFRSEMGALTCEFGACICFRAAPVDEYECWSEVAFTPVPLLEAVKGLKGLDVVRHGEPCLPICDLVQCLRQARCGLTFLCEPLL